MKLKQKHPVNSDLSRFVKCVCEKNYAQANKYLQSIMEQKFKAKLKAHL
jgi:uncharacterized protein YqiB (DUF1249 family)